MASVAKILGLFCLLLSVVGLVAVFVLMFRAKARGEFETETELQAAAIYLGATVGSSLVTATIGASAWVIGSRAQREAKQARPPAWSANQPIPSFRGVRE